MENFKNIDLYSYKWPKYGITDTHLERCKEIAMAFAHELYGNWNIEKLWEDTYPLYLEQDFDAKTVEKLVKRDSAILRKYGWAQYAWAELSQGWWHFIEYIAQHYNN